MESDLVVKVKNELARTQRVSTELLRQIDSELSVSPLAELWILRGDAIQLSDSEEYSIEDVEKSYLSAIEVDPKCACARLQSA